MVFVFRVELRRMRVLVFSFFFIDKVKVLFFINFYEFWCFVKRWIVVWLLFVVGDFGKENVEVGVVNFVV